MKVEERILILASTGRDARLIGVLLRREGYEPVECADVLDLCREIVAGAGAALITDESISEQGADCLLRTIEQQPPWSDLPVILFPTNESAAGLLISVLGVRANVTIFERPIRQSILICAVQSALRARRRQYETRGLLSRLEESDRQKDVFLATLSHELRTPLTSIVGWVHLIKSQDLSPEVYNRALDTIERNTFAQTRLIEDILSVSKIIAGKLAIERKPVLFAEIVQEAVTMVGPSAASKAVDVTVHSMTPDCVVGDPVRLQQIVWNLLSNAIKFTPGGGSVSVELARDASMLQLVVSDTGIGIDAGVLPHIFEHFRQADSSTTRLAGGLGLGLAIAKKLVELHEGTIEALSAGLNRGTTIIVRLPVHEELPVISTPSPVDDEALPLQDQLVLLVEDHPDSRALLAFVLRNSGATVLEAETAKEALELFRNSKPDLIISDIGLADEDGYQLMARIRQEEPPGVMTPAVALTGFADPESERRAIAAGYQLHIAKPIQPEQIVFSTMSLLRAAHQAKRT